eukprot:gene15894-17494_t
MASVARPAQIDSDSVIYEHIIPRNVRQSWLRRSSFGSYDFHQEHQEFSSIDVPTKDCPLDTNLVSHDVQVESMKSKELRIESEHITEEEEIAVFNAWGVKLRHIRKRSKDNTGGVTETSGLSERKGVPGEELTMPSGSKSLHSCKETEKNSIDKSNIIKTIKQSENKPRSHADVSKESSKVLESVKVIKQSQSKPRSHPDISNNLPKATTETSARLKKERPKSMPLINTEKLNECNKEVGVGVGSQRQSVPKAYKSPNAKVPWKRPASMKTSPRGSNFEHKSNKISTSDENINIVILPNETENKVTKLDSVGDNKPASDEVDIECLIDEKLKNVAKHGRSSKINNVYGISKANGNEELLSVLKRRRSFERLDIEMESQQSLSVQHQKDLKSVVNRDAEIGQVVMGNKTGSAHLQESKNDKDRLEKVDQMNLVEDREKVQKFQGDKSVISDDRRRDEKPFGSQLKKSFTSEEKLAGKKSEVDANGNDSMTANLKALDIESMVEKSQVILPVTKVKERKRKVGNMIIQSGDLREQQEKLKPQVTGVEIDQGRKAAGNTSIAKSQMVVESEVVKSEMMEQCQIPVTNLDEMIMDNNEEKAPIPVTNLDDIPNACKREKPSLNLTNLKSKKGNSSGNFGGQHFCPIKKVDYNDSRELITPKVYFEKPIGLKSVLSPKRKSLEKRKLRVSFRAEELAKVHEYPSETAATEIFDEENKIVTSFDSESAGIAKTSELASYIPNCIDDFSGTVERERAKLAAANTENHMDDHAKCSELQATTTYDSSGDLFTETSSMTASAILF